MDRQEPYFRPKSRELEARCDMACRGKGENHWTIFLVSISVLVYCNFCGTVYIVSQTLQQTLPIFGVYSYSP